MLEKSLGLLFYLKKPQNYKNEVMDIYLRITVDGIPKDLSVKRSWEKSKWDGKKNRAIGNKEDARSLNEFLDVLQNKAYQARKHLIDHGRVVTAIAVRNILSGADQRKRMLMLLFKAHNNELMCLIGKGVAEGTWSNFNTTYDHMSEFLKTQYKIDDINILSLDLEFIKKLYNWFKGVKNCNHNTSLKYIANMKKIVLDCVDNKWLPGDPFVKFDMARDEVDTVYLTADELQAIIEKRIENDRLSRVRDLFIFCCFTGLSFIDVKQLKRSEVSLGAKDELRICKNRQKTGTPAVIPVLPIVQLILEKYAEDEYCIAKDLLLPVLSNQKYNAYLKELADICYVEKGLSSKMARNTFATTVTLANNVPLETISKMMGHKTLRQTQHYAKVLAIKVSEDMVLLQKRLEKNRYLIKSQI